MPKVAKIRQPDASLRQATNGDAGIEGRLSRRERVES